MKLTVFVSLFSYARNDFPGC